MTQDGTELLAGAVVNAAGLSAQALVHQALRSAPASAWRMDAGDVNLVFAGLRSAPAAAVHA